MTTIEIPSLVADMTVETTLEGAAVTLTYGGLHLSFGMPLASATKLHEALGAVLRDHVTKRVG